MVSSLKTLFPKTCERFSVGHYCKDGWLRDSNFACFLVFTWGQTPGTLLACAAETSIPACLYFCHFIIVQSPLYEDEKPVLLFFRLAFESGFSGQKSHRTRVMECLKLWVLRLVILRHSTACV